MSGNEFARWFVHQLKRRDWSQAEFSRKTGTSTGVVSHWATGRRIPDPAPRPIADYRAAHAVVTDAAMVVRTASDDVLARIVASVHGSAFLDLRTKVVTWTFEAPFADLLG